jgi:hypothetical protein
MSSSRQFSPAPSPDLTPGTGGSLLDTVPEVHLLDRLAVVFKHVRLISAVFAIVVAMAMLESYSATPMYRSLSRIVIQDERMTAIGTLNSNDPAYWQDPEPYFNTQYRILQSRGLARRVIRTMAPPPPAQPSAFSRALALPRQLVNRWRWRQRPVRAQTQPGDIARQIAPAPPEKPETLEDYDDNGVKTTTILHKPTVETFLMDKTGEVKAARELGFDYVELNSQLSTILLKKLTTIYKPLHEIGKDEEYLAVELREIGLKAPQREAVKAVMKVFASGRKGIGIRANTGTGKTWMAKAVKYIAGAKRSIMVTEPQLVPQMVNEYEHEGFQVHVIDSWERLRELARTRPKGLYLIAYTRLRMHPEFVPVTKEKKVRTKEGIKYAQACLSCSAEVKVTRGSKEHCPVCGDHSAMPGSG